MSEMVTDKAGTDEKRTSARRIPTTPPPKLIKAYEALKLLEHFMGGAPTTKAIIADKIKDGEIRAYASRHWTTARKNRQKVWADGAPLDAERNVQIRRQVLLGASGLPADLAVWKWRRGDFQVTYKRTNNQILRHMYLKVKFAKDDVEALLNEAKEALRARSKGGRHIAEDEWRKVWFAMMDVIAASPITAFASKKQFCGMVFTRYQADDGQLAENTIRSQMNTAYDILQDRARALVEAPEPMSGAKASVKSPATSNPAE